MWRSRNAAQVDDFDALDFFEQKKARRLDRFSSFSVAYTIGTDFRPATRPPAASITFWDGWGES